MEAFAERMARDRAVVAAFDSGATGREIAAAGGFELNEMYKIHRRADSIKAEVDLERRAAETTRRIEL